MDNGYGWGLSDDEADNEFIGIESEDGEWASGTFFRNAYQLSFNTKAIWHGIHSQPFIEMLKQGEEKEVVSRAYMAKGNIKGLYERIRNFMKWPEIFLKNLEISCKIVF